MLTIVLVHGAFADASSWNGATTVWPWPCSRSMTWARR
jgi:hypothetical protein